jgi:hypothetical protein
MKPIGFFIIPEWNRAYKATMDCCYEVVAFGENEMDVAGKIDQEGDPINSWDLFCHCHPSIEIHSIDEAYYYQLKAMVNAKREKGN